MEEKVSGQSLDEAHQAAIRAVSDDAALRNLSLLVRLRWIALAGQLMAILSACRLLGIELHVGWMVAILAVSACVNLFAGWRCRQGRPVHDATVTIELLVDVAALTALLFFSGGASNPFVTLYILQVMLALVLIPIPQVFVILAATTIAYMWLLGNGFPLNLPMAVGPTPSFSNLHLVGMFVSFVLASGLLTWCLNRIRGNLATRDNQIAAMQQRIVEDENFVRLGVMASSTAHELGTPLTTISVTLDEWASFGAPADPEEARETLAQVQAEVARCRRIVTGMLFASGLDRFDDAESLPIGEFLEDVAEEWREDGGNLEFTLPEGAIATDLMIVDPMLEQAIRNILMNADQAGATHMTVEAARLDDGNLLLEFRDDGPGFPPEVLEHPIRPVQSGRGLPGRGFGLYLLSNAVRRMGGDWSIANASHGGAVVHLTLPLIVKEERT